MHHDHADERASTRLAMGLGWFSIALGVAELTAPRRVARFIGIRRPNGAVPVLRAMGAREIASGVGVLSNPRAAAWMWSRVAGDGLDLWLLQQAMYRRDAEHQRLLPAAAATLAVTVADLVCATQLSRSGEETPHRPAKLEIERVATINRSIEDVYRFWRDFRNLPRVMRSLESVDETGEGRTRWRLRAPAGVRIEWNAETTEERENERLAWRSLDGTVAHQGSVTFRRAPGARGTELRVRLEYMPPGGAAGATIAWLLEGTFERQIQDDLRRCKQFLETGEIPLSEGPGLWRPARPSKNPDDLRSDAGAPR
jgi:uncharacterized membrane protein